MTESIPLDDLKNGDEAAFTRLVAIYHRRLVNLCRSIVGDGAAEEVVQEAWISIHRALPDFAGRSTLKTWIYTITRNSALSWLRRQGREVSLDSILEQVDTSDPAFLSGDRFNESGRWQQVPGAWGTESVTELLERDELQRCINHAIDTLEPIRQTVLVMRDLDQLPYDEICNTLGVSHSNVRVLLHRARLEVHRRIDRFMETGEC